MGAPELSSLSFDLLLLLSRLELDPPKKLPKFQRGDGGLEFGLEVGWLLEERTGVPDPSTEGG